MSAALLASGIKSGVNDLNTHTPADSQDRDLAVMAPTLLWFPRRRPHHQGPLLLAAAGADVLVTRPADGVQVAAGVLGSSRGRVWRHGGHRGGGGVHRGGGEWGAENRFITSPKHRVIYIKTAFVMDLGQCMQKKSYLIY